jgi:lysozyme
MLNLFLLSARSDHSFLRAVLQVKLIQGVIDLICISEHLALTAYQDCSPKKILTIGWGHTGPEVVEGLTCTKEQADAWLMSDLTETCKLVTHALGMTLNNYQFSALVSLTYNIGYGNLLKSDVLKYIHAQEIYKAADAFLELDHSDGVEIAGLRTRREAERSMFLTGLVPSAPPLPVIA